MAGHKSAALVTLKFQYPVANFKHKGGKFRIGLDAPPAAERLHHPGNLAEAAIVTEAMAIVAKRILQAGVLDFSQPGFRCYGQSQQCLARSVILMNIRHLPGNSVGGDAAVAVNAGPDRLRQRSDQPAAMITHRKFTDRKDKKCDFRNRWRAAVEFQPRSRLADAHALEQ